MKEGKTTIQFMEERRQAAAALIIIVGAGRGGSSQEHDDGVAPESYCNLCGDVGFREALLPCGARGCSRLQHTYCGSRNCPEVVDDVKTWRCEWCAREGANHQAEGEEEEEEDSSRKRSRRVPPSRSLSPPPAIKEASSSSPQGSTDKERRTARHREDRRESTLPAATARSHAPRASSPSLGTNVSVEADTVMHQDNPSISTRGAGSRALDRWKNLAKRTRLGGKKYKLLADVLC